MWEKSLKEIKNLIPTHFLFAAMSCRCDKQLTFFSPTYRRGTFQTASNTMEAFSGRTELDFTRVPDGRLRDKRATRRE